MSLYLLSDQFSGAVFFKFDSGSAGVSLSKILIYRAQIRMAQVAEPTGLSYFTSAKKEYPPKLIIVSKWQVFTPED